jgi:parvulin-like peptidyl-prolyl isomerase
MAAAVVRADEPKAEPKAEPKPEKKAEKKVDKLPGAQAVSLERVSAVVDDTVILESEVATRAVPLMSENGEPPTDPQARQSAWRTAFHKALQQMVEEQLIIQAAQEAKLEVTDEEVQKALDSVKTQNHVTDKQLETALAGQGTSLAQYKKDIRRQILRLRAVNVLVRPRVQVSEDEVKAKYEKLSGQSAVVTEVHLRHILVALPDKPQPADLEAARQKAGEIVARARGGEDFQTLAKQLSQDAATKAQGGDLGWYKRGELPTEWEEILFAMEPEEVRGPINGPRGLHVFQVIENKKESVRPYAEVKDQLREQIFQDEMDKQTKVWLQELRKKAHVDEKM